MMRRSGLLSTMLCAVLLTLCIAGCGADSVDDTTGEDVSVVEPVEVIDAAAAEEIVEKEESITDERADSDEISDAEQTDVEDASEEEEVSYKGPALSILGDSISTFDGWIPEGCNIFYPFNGAVTDVSQTWWMQLLDDTGMELCRNDSSSGSTCAGDSLSVDNPQYGCSDCRISLLTGKRERTPDAIIVYMGTNDLLVGVPLGDNDGTQSVEEGMIDNFSDAYCLILDKIASNYPMAQIYCCTLAPIGDWGTDQPFVTFINGLGLTSEDYSKQIQIIAENKGIPVIDLHHCGIEIDNLQEMTTDGVHLTPVGMECVERAMLRSLGPASGEQ